MGFIVCAKPETRNSKQETINSKQETININNKTMKKTLRRVPPAPDVMVRLYMDYKNSGFKGSFKKYLESIGFTDPADDQVGMDDSAVVKRTHLHAPPHFISIPSTPI